MLRNLLAATCGVLLLVGPSVAEDKVPVELTLSLKKDSIAWPYGASAKEFEAKLKETIDAKKPENLPKPPAIEGVLRITNTGKEKATLYVEGDTNVLTLTLKGPGVTNANAGKAFTTDFRGPRAADLEPGKSVEIPVKSLSDGFRRASRYVYPLSPGEYKLSATYQLATQDGGKGPLLKSNEVTLKVESDK
jgi:hypothetical protein